MLGRAALLLMSLIWGSSFFILKNTLESVSTLYVLAIRFSGAAVLLCLFCLRDLKKLDRAYLFGGALMGVCLFAAYVLQTFGLTLTTPLSKRSRPRPMQARQLPAESATSSPYTSFRDPTTTWNTSCPR